MGMKAAALSMSPAFEVYSWQEPRSYYSMILDVDEIGNSRSNLIELPDPTLNENLPSEIVGILTRPMSFPKNPSESQTLLAKDADELAQRLGRSGTIVYMPECDRLTYRKASTLVDHATKETRWCKGVTGKAEAAKLQDPGISPKQWPKKMSGRKRSAHRPRQELA